MIKKDAVYWNNQLELAHMQGSRQFLETIVEAVESLSQTELALLDLTGVEKDWARFVIDTKRNVMVASDFPDGELERNPEGSLLLNVSVVKGRIVINFGEQLSWIGMRPKEARELVRAIQQKSDEAECSTQN